MISFRKCPLCGKRTLNIKYDEPNVTYYSHKAKCKKIKIYKCGYCYYQQEVRHNSFSKALFKEFKKLRNETTKKNINDVIWLQSYLLHMTKTATKSDLERLLYLDRNYFQDILNDNRKISSSDAILMEILFNFPFIVKCAAHNFEIQKCIEILKEFISQFDNIDWEEYSKRNKDRRFPHNIDEFYKSKYDCTKMPTKEELEEVNK